MSDLLHSRDFLPHLHEQFLIRLPGIEPIELELVGVAEWGDPVAPGQRQPFSLAFLGPVSQQYLLQSTFHFEHPQMGALDIFIVPLGPQGGRMQYQAVFS